MSVAIDSTDASVDKDAFDEECVSETDDDRPVEMGSCSNDNPFCFTYTTTG